MRKNATYIGKFYTTDIQWYWYYIGLFLIIVIMTILKWKRKEEAMEFDLQMFNPLEIKLLRKLIELKPKEYLTTHDINDILEAKEKSQENQRKIRYNVIKQINKKLKTKYNLENGIERNALPEDKRLIIYKLDPALANELKKLI